MNQNTTMSYIFKVESSKFAVYKVIYDNKWLTLVAEHMLGSTVAVDCLKVRSTNKPFAGNIRHDRRLNVTNIIVEHRRLENVKSAFVVDNFC